MVIHEVGRSQETVHAGCTAHGVASHARDSFQGVVYEGTISYSGVVHVVMIRRVCAEVGRVGETLVAAMHRTNITFRGDAWGGYLANDPGVFVTITAFTLRGSAPVSVVGGR